MLLLALAMAAAVADAPASSQPAAPPVSAPAASNQGVNSANDPNKVICREEQVTGSHFERRVCMTRAAWDKQTQDALRMERQLNEQAATNGGSTPP